MAVQIVKLIAIAGYRLKRLRRLYRGVLKDLKRMGRTWEVI
tara:strand:- start:1766 stop:1888 length:123 start_codon:yes stop_codon:yes gene_type:complete